MNKKIIVFLAIIVILVVGIGGYFLISNDKNKEEEKTSINNSNVNDNQNKANGSEPEDTGKVLVVYFSATNNTKSVAEKIAENLSGDIFLK